MKKSRMVSIFIAFGIYASASLAGAAGKMYWADNESKIQRANLDGSNVEDCYTGLTVPVGIAIDATDGMVYWTIFGGGQSNGSIQRANLDCTGVVQTLVTGLGTLFDIAVDPAGGKMYWAVSNVPKIQCANLDGTGVTDVKTGLNAPSGIALDLINSKVYWTESNGNQIKRANLACSSAINVENLVGITSPRSIAVSDGKIYWSDVSGGVGTIRRANLNGTNEEDLTAVSDGLKVPLVAVDALASKVYWTDSGTNKIQRRNLGSGMVEEMYDGGMSFHPGFMDLHGPITLQIGIDIKPGSDPNCFNINGHGVIPVAILGSETFDVTDIDLDSLLFGGLSVRVRGNKGPLCHLEEVNGDTYLDLVCQFKDDSTNWMPGSGNAMLTGLIDITEFEGTDIICVVP